MSDDEVKSSNVQLWPVTSEPAFQAMHKLHVARLVQIHDGQSSLELAAFWNFVGQACRHTIGVQPGNDGG